MKKRIENLLNLESREEFSQKLREIYSEIHTPEDLKMVMDQVKVVVDRMKTENPDLSSKLDEQRKLRSKEQGLKIKREYGKMADEIHRRVKKTTR